MFTDHPCVFLGVSANTVNKIVMSNDIDPDAKAIKSEVFASLLTLHLWSSLSGSPNLDDVAVLISNAVP